MNYGELLEEMIAPLGMYDKAGKFQAGEMVCIGTYLEMVSERLEEIQREMTLLTAEDWGIEAISDLFLMRPQSLNIQEKREALRALMQISGDSFTVEALNQTLAGCGTLAKVSETEEVGVVEISFPNIPGSPPGFQNICYILENILPAHLAVRYCFWSITWKVLAEKIASFGDLAESGLSWKELESFVG